MKLQKVYRTKRRLKDMLRAKINGRAYRCGKYIHNEPYWVQAINSKGVVVVEHNETGEQITLTSKPIDTLDNLG